jgi:hypothetical protein
MSQSQLLSLIRIGRLRKLQSDTSGIEIGYRNSRAGIDVCFGNRNLIEALVGIGKINSSPDLVGFDGREKSL